MTERNTLEDSYNEADLYDREEDYVECEGNPMDTQLNTTLYDVIRGHEDHFEAIVYKAVESSLVDLGDRIYSLDWANVSVSKYASVSCSRGR